MFDGEASPALKKVIVEAMKSTPYEENFQSGYRNQYQNSHSNYQNWDEDELMDSENTYYQYWKRKLGNDRVMNKNDSVSHLKDLIQLFQVIFMLIVYLILVFRVATMIIFGIL